MFSIMPSIGMLRRKNPFLKIPSVQRSGRHKQPEVWSLPALRLATIMGGWFEGKAKKSKHHDVPRP